MDEKALTKLRVRMLLATIDNDTTDRMVNCVEFFLADEEKKLKEEYDNKKQAVDTDEIEAFLSYAEDESYYYSEVKKLLYEMAIVAIYKKVEIDTKRIVQLVFPDIDQCELFRVGQLKKELKKKGIDLTRIRCYKSFDELRCINNCIKHSGKVDAELAQYRGWKQGEELGDLKKTYIRFLPAMKSYMRDFSKKVTRKIK